MNLRDKCVLVLCVLAAACASSPRPEPGLPPSSFPSPYPGAPAYAESPAIASLMEGARTESAGGRPANAAASLERALRIEPRNPRLWHQLSRVRIEQREFVQAENCAARSNSWAGSDAALRAENWRVIAQAREARGDTEGARAALETAQRQR